MYVCTQPSNNENRFVGILDHGTPENGYHQSVEILNCIKLLQIWKKIVTRIQSSLVGHM